MDSTLPTASISPAAVAMPVASSSSVSAKAQIAAKLLTSEQLLIADELQIPANILCTGAPLSLQANYTQYLVYLEACQTLVNLENTETWPSGLNCLAQWILSCCLLRNKYDMISGARHFLMS